jgi:tetratricopeptide (TPR) repeat protein
VPVVGGRPELPPEPAPELFSGEPGGPRRPTASPLLENKLALSNLPDRNPFFTGRENVLAQLQEALAARGRAALSGLGGVGKTQTAIEYAYRHSDEYDYIFWATADSREALVSGYVTIASLLNLPESNNQNQMLVVQAVKRWLGSHERWLLILDNADDLAMTREFIPPRKNGHVLLTTRAQATGAVARGVEIQEMGTEEGALFLLRRAKYITENAPLDVASETDQAKASEIATQLGGLPLALDQAGAYIEETESGLLAYLELYRHHAPELLRRRGMMTFDYPKSVATTWALSFENIEKANPAAAELLRFCAFLHPNAIPEEVFSEGAQELGPVLGPVGSNALKLNAAISEILKYSLLRRDSTAGNFEIHRLVQVVLKQAMDEATQRLWAERVVRAVSRAFPKVDFSTWALCERLLSQAQVCAELIDQWAFEFLEAPRLLNGAGSYLFERGRYAEAEPLYQRSLAISEKPLGPEHALVANSCNSLAALYHAQGRYAEAEPLYQRSLAIWEKALGPEHPHVATNLNNLAALYRAQGRNAEGEPLYQRSLGIREKALGPEHPHVATSLNNLATLYYAQSRNPEAEPLLRRSLAILEKALGPEHPDVATILANYAFLLRSMGREEEAARLESCAEAIRAKSA